METAIITLIYKDKEEMDFEIPTDLTMKELVSVLVETVWPEEAGHFSDGFIYEGSLIGETWETMDGDETLDNRGFSDGAIIRLRAKAAAAVRQEKDFKIKQLEKNGTEEEAVQQVQETKNPFVWKKL